MVRLAGWMEQIISSPEDEALQARVAAEVEELCDGFPAPGLPVR